MESAGERRPRVRYCGSLAMPDGRDSLVSVGLSADGPVAMWSTRAGESRLRERDEQPGWASFARSRPSVEPPVVLACYPESEAEALAVSVPALPVAFPFVQCLPDGSFLVVGARARWTSEGPEDNALVVDRAGVVVRRGCLGDGLQHVQVTSDGVIWTGYFDEGVFGNYGWGQPGPRPLGAGGVVAWSSNLEKVWELDPEEGLVADCYALNATPQEVLACPYTDFPVVRIQDGRESVLATSGIAGPRGIIADGDRIAIIGSYKDPSTIVVGDVASGTFREELRMNLWAPDGAPLPEARVHCRGSEVHFFAGADWFSFDLRDLP